MRMLGLPEELVDCAALSAVGDPLQKLTLICRTVEGTLRTAHSADVVSGIEMGLFRALWRCFVVLKKLRLMDSGGGAGGGRRSVEDRRPGEELEVLEAARRIFDLLSIVNKKIVKNLLSLMAMNSNLVFSTNNNNNNGKNNNNNNNNLSSNSNSNNQFTSAEENIAFKTLCRFISLRVLYSSSSDHRHQQNQSNENSEEMFGDDGEAEYFRLVFSKNWLQADVSMGPAARYLSLMKTCENGMRHDIATEYFEQYEINHPFLVKKMKSFSENEKHQFQEGDKEVEEEEKLFLSFQVEQFELVLKGYWNLLISCGEHGKVIQVLEKYLDIFEKYNHQLPASLLSVAMRSVGEVKNAKVAARTMASLFRSFSKNIPTTNNNTNTSTTTSTTITTTSDNNENENNNNSPTNLSTSSNFRLPTQYEMLTCLTALAKCAHPSFHQALETCLQENLIDTTTAASPLRVAELRLQYALNDPIDSLSIAQSEITRCEEAGCSIKNDFRCAGLILQILLRVDDESFMKVFREVVALNDDDDHDHNEGEKKTSRSKSSKSNNKSSRIYDIPSSWVDWLVVWSLRRRYELTQEERKYILDVIEFKRKPSYFVAPQAELIKLDFQFYQRKRNNLNSLDGDENENYENDLHHQQQLRHADPRCVWPKRRSALMKLQTESRNEEKERCVSLSFERHLAFMSSSSSSKSPLVQKLMTSANSLEAASDAMMILKRLESL